PAGVAIAAVSASFALGLVAKVLAVSARRNTLPQNTAGLEPVTAAAQAASQRMLQLAGADTAAFEAYLTANRLPRATETERRARQSFGSQVRLECCRVGACQLQHALRCRLRCGSHRLEPGGILRERVAASTDGEHF